MRDPTPKFTATIPDWPEGKPLSIRNVEAESPAAAEARVVAWVNRTAGYHYCGRPPEGTRIAEQHA